MPDSYKEDGRPADQMKYKSGKWYRIKIDESLNSDIPQNIKFAGIYIIVYGKKCIYIGQSKNIYKRLKTHIRLTAFSSNWKTPWGVYPKLDIAIRKEKYNFERMMIEAKFIDRLQPIFNGLSAGQVYSTGKKIYHEISQESKG